MTRPKIDRARVAELNGRGFRDVDIADLLRCSTRQIQTIRKELGLPRVLKRKGRASRAKAKWLAAPDGPGPWFVSFHAETPIGIARIDNEGVWIPGAAQRVALTHPGFATAKWFRAVAPEPPVRADEDVQPVTTEATP